MTFHKPLFIAAITLAAASVACGDDSSSSGSGGSGGGGTGGSTSSGNQSLCAKYGGADNVASVVQNNVVGAIASDCRISVQFTSLDEAGLTHVVDCLTTQVQELFGCDGISYAGSTDSNGTTCRSMADAHAGLAISQGDFDALIEDVVQGLTEAGVEEADINAAAPALLGMADDIVEDTSADPSQSTCN